MLHYLSGGGNILQGDQRKGKIGRIRKFQNQVFKSEKIELLGEKSREKNKRISYIVFVIFQKISQNISLRHSALVNSIPVL